MPHYQILRCEANAMDCSYSWRVKLTEYGYCITNKDITNMTKTDEHEHIHGTSRNNVLDFTLGLGFELFC